MAEEEALGCRSGWTCLAPGPAEEEDSSGGRDRRPPLADEVYPMGPESSMCAGEHLAGGAPSSSEGERAKSSSSGVRLGRGGRGVSSKTSSASSSSEDSEEGVVLVLLQNLHQRPHHSRHVRLLLRTSLLLLSWGL